MDGQRQREGSGRGRRRKPRPAEAKRGPPVEPVRIAARRPDSPLLVKVPSRALAASAAPRKKRGAETEEAAEAPVAAESPPKAEPVRRAARIVQAGKGPADEQEREREKLLGRLMQSQGRGAISRAANEFLGRGFALPDEQEVHLQLLEHFDEPRACESLRALCRLLEEDQPVKRPVLDQRLRRLEEHADEASTRDLAAELRRSLRG